MSWTDEEIDKLFSNSDEGMSFEYKEEYWKEMEAKLPQRKRGLDGLWFITAVGFLVMLGASMSGFEALNTSHTVAWLQIDVESNKNNKNSQSEIQNPQVQNESDADDNLTATILVDFGQIDLSNLWMPDYQVIPYYNSHDPRVYGYEGLPGVYLDEDQSTVTIAENPIEDIEIEPESIQSELNRELAAFNPNKPKGLTAFGFYVEANGGVSQSVVTPSNHTVSLYGLGLGVQMRNNNFVMTAGINGVMTNHADIKLNREAKLYGFGSEVVRCELDYDRLYHIEIALNFGYAIGNHTVMLGVRPSYLVGSRVNYVRHEGVSAVSNETYHGYMEGLQRWGVKPTFGYAYQFNSWQVGANIGVQMLPALNEDFIDGENKHFPIDGQIYLRKFIQFGRK